VIHQECIDDNKIQEKIKNGEKESVQLFCKKCASSFDQTPTKMKTDGLKTTTKKRNITIANETENPEKKKLEKLDNNKSTKKNPIILDESDKHEKKKSRKSSPAENEIGLVVIISRLDDVKSSIKGINDRMDKLESNQKFISSAMKLKVHGSNSEDNEYGNLFAKPPYSSKLARTKLFDEIKHTRMLSVEVFIVNNFDFNGTLGEYGGDHFSNEMSKLATNWRKYKHLLNQAMQQMAKDATELMNEEKTWAEKVLTSKNLQHLCGNRMRKPNNEAWHIKNPNDDLVPELRVLSWLWIGLEDVTPASVQKFLASVEDLTKVFEYK